MVKNGTRLSIDQCIEFLSPCRSSEANPFPVKAARKSATKRRPIASSEESLSGGV